MHKDAKKIKARIRSAFNKLKGDKIVALANFACCNNCGVNEIMTIVKDTKANGWAFYHAQDNDEINESGLTYITFGDNTSIAYKIVKALKDAKLKVIWNGDMHNRIFVKGLL
jgi:hypothetical protein